MESLCWGPGPEPQHCGSQSWTHPTCGHRSAGTFETPGGKFPSCLVLPGPCPGIAPDTLLLHLPRGEPTRSARLTSRLGAVWLLQALALLPSAAPRSSSPSGSETLHFWMQCQ